jgi:hypothetical protein
LSLLPSNSFYSSFAKKKGLFGGGYQAPVSSFYPDAPASAPKPPSAPSAPSGGGSPSGPPPGFTAIQGGLPPDPAYQASIGAFAGTRDNTIAGLVQNRGAGLQEYGYTEDPNTHAIAFDPNNPYSQAALLRKHYQQAKTGNTTSYAASGQLYAGSLQNAQNASTDSYNASDNALTNAVINFLANNTIQQNAAGDTYNTNAAGALGQSVQNAPNNPLYSPSSAAGLGGATVSGDANGNMAITGGPGGSALVPQQANSTVKLANGYSIVYGPDGKALYFLDPQGNKMTGKVG